MLELLVFIPFFPLGRPGFEYYSACKGGARQTRQGFGGKDWAEPPSCSDKHGVPDLDALTAASTFAPKYSAIPTGKQGIDKSGIEKDRMPVREAGI